MNKLLLIAGACGIVLMAVVDHQSPHAAQVTGGEKHAAQLMKCAEECSNCQRACDACAAHCAKLMADGKKEHRLTLGTCLDCSAYCSTAASIVARRGPMSDIICKACAEACARCAKECEKHSSDAEMKRCAEECRRCETACREMMTHLSGAKATERAK